MKSYRVLVTAFLLVAPVVAQGKTRSSSIVIPPRAAAKIQDILKRAPKNVVKEGDTCTDFSGTWSGTCVDERGEVYENTRIIDQGGCEDIIFGDSYLLFGGANRQGAADATWSYDASIFIDWNPARTGFRQRNFVAGRGLYQDSFYSSTTSMDFSKVNGRLMIRSQTEAEVEHSGHMTIERMWEECTLEKQ